MKKQKLYEAIQSAFELTYQRILDLPEINSVVGNEQISEFKHFCQGFESAANVFIKPEELIELLQFNDERITELNKLVKKLTKNKPVKERPIQGEYYYRDTNVRKEWTFVSWAEVPSKEVKAIRKYKDVVNIIFDEGNGLEERYTVSAEDYQKLIQKGIIDNIK